MSAFHKVVPFFLAAGKFRGSQVVAVGSLMIAAHFKSLGARCMQAVLSDDVNDGMQRKTVALRTRWS